MSGPVSIRKVARSASPPHWRPSTRADCSTFQRPCPYLSCRHHLDSDEHGGTVRATIDNLSPNRPSCSLDLAEAGSRDLDQITELLGLWHTGVETALRSGLAKLRKDPSLRDLWEEIASRNGGHSLWEAQLYADSASEAEEEAG